MENNSDVRAHIKMQNRSVHVNVMGLIGVFENDGRIGGVKRWRLKLKLNQIIE